MSVAVDIRDYLVAQGVGQKGGTATWGIFVGTEPANPDSVITIYDTGGSWANPDAQLSDPTIQARIRSHDYVAGYSKGEELRDALILPTARTINGHHYTGIWLTSDLIKIGQDQNNRNLFTVNFRLMRQPAN